MPMQTALSSKSLGMPFSGGCMISVMTCADFSSRSVCLSSPSRAAQFPQHEGETNLLVRIASVNPHGNLESRNRCNRDQRCYPRDCIDAVFCHNLETLEKKLRCGAQSAAPHHAPRICSDPPRFLTVNVLCGSTAAPVAHGGKCSVWRMILYFARDARAARTASR